MLGIAAMILEMLLQKLVSEVALTLARAIVLILIQTSYS